MPLPLDFNTIPCYPLFFCFFCPCLHKLQHILIHHASTSISWVLSSKSISWLKQGFLQYSWWSTAVLQLTILVYIYIYIHIYRERERERTVGKNSLVSKFLTPVFYLIHMFRNWDHIDICWVFSQHYQENKYEYIKINKKSFLYTVAHGKNHFSFSYHKCKCFLFSFLE